MLDFASLRALDAADPLRPFRDEFRLPAGKVYLDGNSLGALPRDTLARITRVVEHEWGQDLISGWLDHDWIDAPTRVGGKLAALIGAQPHEVLAADSTSANIYKLVSAALQANPDRRTILSEPGNFPTDLYMIQGALATQRPDARLELRERHEIESAIGPDTALILLTHVHYKTADVYDMAAISARARAMGALTLWDLSHSAGAVEVDLNGCGADLAVGCGYKYLNGGPGAPAFLFVAERWRDRLISPLRGWMGHARPFDFVDDYRPAEGIMRFACGTPPIIGLAGLEAGLDVLLRADMKAVAEKSARLCATFIDLVAEHCPEARLVGPPRGAARGSHVSFVHPQAYEIVKALIDLDVIGDFRAPDIMRFGMTPLYVGYEDIGRAVEALRAVLRDELWRSDRYRTRARVT